jgi:hypothetical protein
MRINRTQDKEYSAPSYFYFSNFSLDGYRSLIMTEDKISGESCNMPDSKYNIDDDEERDILNRFSKKWLMKWFQNGIRDHCRDSESDSD